MYHVFVINLKNKHNQPTKSKQANKTCWNSTYMKEAFIDLGSKGSHAASSLPGEYWRILWALSFYTLCHKSQCWHKHRLVIKLRMFQIISHFMNVFSVFVSMETIKLNKSVLLLGWFHLWILLARYLMSRMKILLWGFQLLLISLLNGKEWAVHCMTFSKVTLTEWNISKG